MIADIECADCYGCGRIHSHGHNGDPMDKGRDCATCGGTGVVTVDCETGEEYEPHVD